MTTPNVQPIFIKKPLIFEAEISNQTVPGVRVGSSVPALIGKAGQNGSLIEEMSLIRSGEQGDNTTIFFYLKNDESGKYSAKLKKYLEDPGYYDFQDETSDVIEIELPKLLSPASCDGSSPHHGLRIPAGWGLYAGLTNAVNNPLVVVATGGDY